MSDRQVANFRYRLKKAGADGKSWAEQIANCVEEVNRGYKLEKVVFIVTLQFRTSAQCVLYTHSVPLELTIIFIYRSLKDTSRRPAYLQCGL